MEINPQASHPIDGQTIFAKLRDALAELYPEEDDTYVVVSDAGLDAKQISFNSRAQTNWHHILTEAIRQNCLDTLLFVVLTAYNDNPKLKDAYTQYCLFLEQGRDLNLPNQLPADGGTLYTLETDGGAAIVGSVNIPAGNFIGRDQHIHGDNVAGDKHVHLADEIHHVHGLPNPYLGLSAYTYEQRAHYGGRSETIARIVALLTRAGEQCMLLFVTGASGSGKSSFAQAGLLPTLEAYYRQHDLPTRRAVMRPSRQPLAGLAEALRQLGLTPQGPFAAVHPYLVGKSSPPASEEQISLLVIDQFEESFTQSASDQRITFFELLASLPPFPQLRMHVIATMRVDYLPDLFAYPALYELAIGGTALRAMTPAELVEAIQQPIRQAYPYGEKRMEAELVTALAQEAAKEATYLPLLQVTCEDIWRQGWLKRAAYGTLTDAIRRRAEEIFAYTIDDSGNPVPRPQAEQEQVLQLFLDLVDVSPKDDVRRDVRRRRSLLELTRGQPLRRRLVNELTAQRLLCMDREGDAETGEAVETVDIIHESLIGNWDRLQHAIEAQREQLQQRARFETELEQWRSQDRTEAYLLDGVRLAEAEELARQEDVALQHSEARVFLQQSIAHHEARRRRQRKVLLGVVGVLALLLMAALGAIWWAVDTNNKLADTNDDLVLKVTEVAQAQATADATAAEAQSRFLATAAINNLSIDPELSILLALEAISATHTIEAEDALHRAVQMSRIQLRFIEHTSSVTSAVFNPDPDRSMIASADEQGRVKIWDAATGIVTHTIPVPSAIIDLLFSSDGLLLAIATADGTAILVNVITGEIFQTLYAHETSINVIAFHPGGTLMATVSNDGTAKVWNIVTGDLVHNSLRHMSPVSSVAFSPDGSLLATSTITGEIRVWDTNSGSVRQFLSDRLGDISSGTINKIVFGADNNTIFSGGWDGYIKQWDVSLKRVTARWFAHEGEIYDLAFSDPTFKRQCNNHLAYLATASSDHTIKIWNPWGNYQKELLTLVGHSGPIRSISFNQDGSRIVSAGSDFTVRVWNAVNSSELDIHGNHCGPVESVKYSPNGEYFATASRDGSLKLWNASTGQILRTFTGHNHQVSSIAFNHDGTLLVSGGGDETVRLWDLAHPDKELPVISDGISWVYDVAISPDDKFIAIASSPGVTLTTIWDLSANKLFNILQGHWGQVWSVAFSPDGQLIATASSDKTARIWNIQSAHEIHVLSGHSGTVRDVAFSPDGKFVATASEDGTARIWEVQTGLELRKFDGHVDIVNSVAFSPNSALLATANGDKTAKIWDVQNGSIVLTLYGHTQAVKDVAFSPNGNHLLTGSIDNTVQQYTLDINKLIQVARHRTTGPPAQDACMQYFATPIC